MAERIVSPPLVDWGSALKSFLSGSLIVGSVFNNYGIFIQSVLFIAGLLVSLDAVLPIGRNTHAVITIIFMFAGGLIALYLSLTSQSVLYMVAVFAFTVLFYLARMLGYLEGFLKR